MSLNVLLSVLLCHLYVYPPVPPVAATPVIDAGSPLTQNAVVAGAVIEFVRVVDCTDNWTDALVDEQPPLVTTRRKYVVAEMEDGSYETAFAPGRSVNDALSVLLCHW